MDLRSKIGLSALVGFWTLILLSLAWTPGSHLSPGKIASTGMTATARFSHTATLLRNNQVLIAGGMERNGVWLSSAELFDPASERFTAAGNMSVARAGATATLLNNGKVLIAGGATSPGKSLASAEVFDPATGVFAATGNMTTPRSHAIAVLLEDGKVLVAGGGTAGDDRKTNSAELYDPAQGRFIPTGSMQKPRSYDTALRLKDGRVLVVGGMSYGDLPNPEIEASAEIYEPASGRFTATGSMSFARYKQGMAPLPGGKILVVGGQTGGSGNRLSSTELYDPAAGRFTRGPEMRTKRFKLHDGVVTLSDGRVLVAGGADQMELYDSASGSFSTVGGVALDGFFFSTATLLGDGKVLLVNGYGSHAAEGAVRHAWVYQP